MQGMRVRQEAAAVSVDREVRMRVYVAQLTRNSMAAVRTHSTPSHVQLPSGRRR